MDCPHIPSMGHADFFGRLARQARAARIPLSGSIELTARCNLRCAHCFINLPSRDAGAQAAELTTAELKSLLDEIAEAGCLWLLLTGGEPLLRSDVLDILGHARSRGLLVTLFTNGTLITQDLADRLADAPPHEVEISLYGCTERTFERVTRVPGSYSRCRRGIELLLERGLPLRLKTPVMTLNHAELPATRAFAQGLGVPFRFDPVLNGRLDGAPGPLPLRLRAQEVVALDQGDPRRMKELWALVGSGLSRVSDPERLWLCGAGETVFHVDPWGRMSPCLMARAPSRDLRQMSFGTWWNGVLPAIRQEPWRTPSPCKTCELVVLCDQCPGWALLEAGDPGRRVDYLCEIAKARAQALGISTPLVAKGDVHGQDPRDPEGSSTLRQTAAGAG